MGIKQSASRKIGEKTLAVRKQLWPNITDEVLWHRKRKQGYTTIPRAMSFILQIMDCLSKGKPVSQTYLTLWCHPFDECMGKIANPRIFASESGFTGQRAETTWKGRMKILMDLGFIDSKPAAAGQYHFVLIFNPYTIIKKLKEKGMPIPEDIYHALIDRTREIGADDLL